MAHSASEYGRELIEAALCAFDDRAQVSPQYLTPSSASLLIVPWEGRHANVPHWVEFNYRHGKTFDILAIIMTLHAITAVVEANAGVRVAIVTNAEVRAEGRQITDRLDIPIFGNVNDKATFLRELSVFLDMRTNSHAFA